MRPIDRVAERPCGVVATIAEAVPQKLEHNDIRYITPAEIPEYDFCPADEEILKEIIARYAK